MGLFDKKNCDICGEMIGLLGNRKLEDGNLCKDCAKKLSPFFSERRRSTVDDIKRQLAYREENAKKLADFSPSITFEGSKKVYIDPRVECFIVTASSNWRNSNPDLISLSQVRNVNTDIKENREEILYEDSEGNERSYVPPRYEYEYAFYVTIMVDSPWFDEIKLELSAGKRPENPHTELYHEYERRMYELADILMRRESRGGAYNGGMNRGGYNDGMNRGGYNDGMNRGGYNAGMVGGVYVGGGDRNGVYVDSMQATRPAGMQREAYQDRHGNAAPDFRQSEEWFCPSCGAQNNGKFCNNCGGMKPMRQMGCANCGWRAAEGQGLPRFCPECGKPLS